MELARLVCGGLRRYGQEEEEEKPGEMKMIRMEGILNERARF